MLTNKQSNVENQNVKTRLHQTGVMSRILRYKMVYLAIFPTFIFLAIFKYYPFFNAFYRSLFAWDGVNYSEFIGFGNFIELFTQDPQFYQALKVMSIFTVADLLKGVVVSLTIALLIHYIRSEKAKYIFRILLVLPAVVPGVVGMLLWKNFMGKEGLINNLLAVIGLEEYTQTWLGNADTVIGALIFMGFPWINGVFCLILIAGLLNIDSEIYDSTKIDGASTWRRIWSIELPMIRPQLSLIIVLAIIGSIQNYENILIITGGGPYGTTMVPGLMLFRNAFDYFRVGYASAIGVFLFGVIITLTIINNKFIKQKS